ncbi:hypothetical protein [Actinoplanes sp. DH11]|uniref:hypothetical protein n=1 Tax=Actinoplanes sp. DH11 TaxID=2857011 RepID=UPI001E2B8543|nr:hypothetical protein [Actinoplanes sp. DH11]
MNPLFTRLFDDAAIFPPGNLPMGEAVAAHRKRQDSPLASLLGPFVCSLGRLDELAEAAAGGPALPVSLVLPGPVADIPVTPGIDVVAVEGPEPVVAGAPRWAYTELHLDAITTSRLAALRGTRSRLKIRTGGVRADAFPSEHGLARALRAAVRAHVPFKLTAGLHDPIRHRDPATGFEHHGFLNVLLATAHALQGGDNTQVASALADQDGHRVAAAIATVDAELARQIRDNFISFGTCSISEPVDGLVRLGLLPEDPR